MNVGTAGRTNANSRLDLENEESHNSMITHLNSNNELFNLLILGKYQTKLFHDTDIILLIPVGKFWYA